MNRMVLVTVLALGASALSPLGLDAAVGANSSATHSLPETPESVVPLQRGFVLDRDLPLSDGRSMRYAVIAPDDIDDDERLPLIVALHFGWQGTLQPRMGGDFLRLLIEPAFAETRAILVAPTSPERSWHHENSEAAVLAMIDAVAERYPVDETRVVLTGFSLGGMGTWFLASHHPDRFSAAIPVASAPVLQRGADRGAGLAEFERVIEEGTAPWIDGLMRVPFYVINSRSDELIPFEPVRRAVEALQEHGAPLRFVALDDYAHFQSARYVEPLREAARWLEGVWSER